MTITYEINPDAVWEDGTPITVADFECTYQANLNTPGSIGTVGYDKIIAVAAGASDQEVVVTLNEVYAPYRGLFSGIIKQAAVEDCNDISGDFGTEMAISGREWKLDSWSDTQSVLVPNENYWGDKPTVDRFVMVPKADSDTQIASLKAGEIDFIYPQYYAGITDALADPNVETKLEFGGDYEALYMNLGKADETRPFADPAFREAFYKSIDLDALFQQIYIPIAAEGKLLTCGPIVPGPFCPEGIFGNKYDQAEADTLLTDAGYAKGADGFWAKDGVVPEIKWMVNSGNTRRENTQAYLIPLLATAGFKVTPDNCEADCVFQQRLPASDYDLGMYISTAPPDPAYLVPSFAGDQIPTEENGNTGQNFQNWDNETATKALKDSDREVDEAKRAELIKTAITEMDKDYILVPLFQFPKAGAWRSDKVDNVTGQLNNYRAFSDTAIWKDVDGDGQIILGAEQWPSCLNPVTECANSSWYVWTVSFPLLPGVYDTTNDSKYVTTNLVTGEPKVEIAGS
ncbi:MAG: ABC transporter substrate-binding protein [Ilumatobacteraceae bacterium]